MNKMCKDCLISPYCESLPGGSFCEAVRSSNHDDRSVEVKIPDGGAFGTLTLNGEQIEVYCGSFTQATFRGVTKRKFTFIEV